ncbi:MAG: mechanosensitive ion channel family protein [Calditrichaeota bacterium]|nr:MAG: mechanosensitive ion channel family protein [Calditrichota bacterium]
MESNSFLTIVSNILKYTLFEINQTPVTLLSLIMFLIVIIIFSILSRVLRKYLVHKLLKYFKFEEGASYTFSRIVHYIVMIIGGLVAFQFIGISFSGLAVLFGFLSVGIGFGLQNVTSNFVAGLILLFERPIQVGDRVTVGDTLGDVVEINIRSTTIRSEKNVAIIVPNSEFISSTVVNWSYGDPKVLMEINVGVSYESDLDLVINTLKEIAGEHPHVLKHPAPEVHLTNFGDSSWDMQLRVWIRHPKLMRQVRSDINCNIVRKFRENQIEIPYPQRDLHLRTPLPVPLSTNEVVS